jgi:hypothetical protein
MADILREHPTLVGGVDDNAYVSESWASEMGDGRWEAWILFVPISTGLKGAFARSRRSRVTAA